MIGILLLYFGYLIYFANHREILKLEEIFRNNLISLVWIRIYITVISECFYFQFVLVFIDNSRVPTVHHKKLN